MRVLEFCYPSYAYLDEIDEALLGLAQEAPQANGMTL
jgi:hypothetical protein